MDMQRQLGTLRHLFVCEKVKDTQNGIEHVHFHLFSQQQQQQKKKKSEE